MLGSFGIKTINTVAWDEDVERTVSVKQGADLPEKSVIAHTSEDLAIIAASLSLADERFIEAEVSGSHLVVKYVTSGYVGGIYPTKVPFTVTVNSGAISSSERIVVTYPWWSNFIWLSVPPASIRSAIDKSLLKSLRDSSGTDAEARLFTATLSALKAVHDEFE